MSAERALKLMVRRAKAILRGVDAAIDWNEPTWNVTRCSSSGERRRQVPQSIPRLRSCARTLFRAPSTGRLSGGHGHVTLFHDGNSE